MKEMTSLERVRAVLNGEMPDRVPVIPQGFMFCAANCGMHIGQINRDPKKMAESQIRTQEQFGYDGCVIDVDDARTGAGNRVDEIVAAELCACARGAWFRLLHRAAALSPARWRCPPSLKKMTIK